MKIKWLGHSCFLLTSDKGVRILTDPFDEKVGYQLPAEEADIVTVSHEHYDHNFVDAVKGDFVLLNKPGSFAEKGIPITGTSTFHDEAGGAKRGKNTVFRFEIDGISICHCGDLGHIPSSEQLMQIGKVDVLLLPVGGIYTVDYAGALEVMKLINPVVTIPMHFKTEALSFELDGVDKFLAAAEMGEKTGKQELVIEKESLQQNPRVIVLSYK